MKAKNCLVTIIKKKNTFHAKEKYKLQLSHINLLILIVLQQTSKCANKVLSSKLFVVLIIALSLLQVIAACFQCFTGIFSLKTLCNKHWNNTNAMLYVVYMSWLVGFGYILAKKHHLLFAVLKSKREIH